MELKFADVEKEVKVLCPLCGTPARFIREKNEIVAIVAHVKINPEDGTDWRGVCRGLSREELIQHKERAAA